MQDWKFVATPPHPPPTPPSPQLKSAAAGNMAIAYQLAHFLGLGIATMVALLMYGSIAPHE
jgi:hypothetical protein